MEMQHFTETTKYHYHEDIQPLYEKQEQQASLAAALQAFVSVPHQSFIASCLRQSTITASG
jgi:hypothetical protein